MKKIFLIFMIGMTLLLTGCGKVNEEKLKDKFINNIKNLKSYYINGDLSINNNDDVYSYDVKVSYKEPDNFKVVLTNKSNNYEQIILRNEGGVYVINTSLNKSFKFQSEWPYNNSQSYILTSLMTDLKNDKEPAFMEKDGNYIFKVSVNYSNNKELVKENIHMDKDGNLKMVEVLTKDDIPKITFKVRELDKKANFKDNYFEGEGTLIIYNGSTYTGQFYHDKYHGKGVITTTIKKENSKPIEQKFDGTFDNGVGKGTYYLGDGNKLIEVTWKNNKLKDGECIKVYPQGNKERGYWKEGHFTAK